jgi:hypothetical protein
MPHLLLSQNLMETPGQVNLPPSVRQGAILRVKMWGAGVRGSGRASDGLGVAAAGAGPGAGVGRAHPQPQRQSSVDERLATVRRIDHNKNLLSFPSIPHSFAFPLSPPAPVSPRHGCAWCVRRDVWRVLVLGMARRWCRSCERGRCRTRVGACSR